MFFVEEKESERNNKGKGRKVYANCSGDMKRMISRSSKRKNPEKQLLPWRKQNGRGFANATLANKPPRGEKGPKYKTERTTYFTIENDDDKLDASATH